MEADGHDKLVKLKELIRKNNQISQKLSKLKLRCRNLFNNFYFSFRKHISTKIS